MVTPTGGNALNSSNGNQLCKGRNEKCLFNHWFVDYNRQAWGFGIISVFTAVYSSQKWPYVDVTVKLKRNETQRTRRGSHRRPHPKVFATDQGQVSKIWLRGGPGLKRHILVWSSLICTRFRLFSLHLQEVNTRYMLLYLPVNNWNDCHNIGETSNIAVADTGSCSTLPAHIHLENHP